MIRYLLLTTIMIGIFYTSASSQESSVLERNIQMRSNEPIVEASAIIISEETGLSQIINAKIEPNGPTLWSIKYSLPEQSKQEARLASILTRTSSGKIKSTPLTQISNFSDTISKDAYCEPSHIVEQTETLAGLDKNALGLLLNVRKTRQNLLKKQIEDKLNSEFVATASKLEQKLGINYPTKLNSKLPLSEIMERVTNLAALILLDKKDTQLSQPQTPDTQVGSP